MKQFFAYIRVSTAKQGEHGVSLPQQREAIERYANSNGILISRWFEEKVTAAKKGRPLFSQMLQQLRSGRAAGVVIHKIDRSARNLKDWSDLGELIDSGTDVRFASESLDMQSRGGRLSADIQAVVAADFIRNLREETKKGFYGRLRQGLYPRVAPIGYLDCGPGKVKTPDSERAHHIHRLFELYATGKHNLTDLQEHMYQLGFRTKSGKKVYRSVLARILAEPFYAGIIKIKKTGQTFEGVHQPLISASLFEAARDVAMGRCTGKVRRHEFAFRRLVQCGHCQYSLIGEIQKGHVYYRCHTPGCPTKSIRESALDQHVLALVEPLTFSADEKAYLKTAITELRHEWAQQTETVSASLRLREKNISDRLDRLTDAYIDGMLDKESFEERKKTLLLERQKLKESSTAQLPERDISNQLEKFLELAGSASLLYKAARPQEKCDLVKTLTSNRVVKNKVPLFMLDSAFQEVANRKKCLSGSPSRDRLRTVKALLLKLADLLSIRTPRLVTAK